MEQSGCRLDGDGDQTVVGKEGYQCHPGCAYGGRWGVGMAMNLMEVPVRT